jgi:hypothetical protein
MFVPLLGAVRADVDRQIGWAKQEAVRQTRHAALIGILAAVAALATLGAIIVGLIALYSWLASKHGSFIAYGMIGGGLLLIALILFTLALAGRRPRLSSRPPLQIARPATLLGTMGWDSRGKVATSGEQTSRLPTSTLRDGSRSILLGTIVLAAVAGLIAGRRL